MKYLYWHRTKGFFWIKLFGYGFRVKDVRRHPLLFSQRVLKHGMLVGNYHFQIIKPHG